MEEEEEDEERYETNEHNHLSQPHKNTHYSTVNIRRRNALREKIITRPFLSVVQHDIRYHSATGPSTHLAVRTRGRMVLPVSDSARRCERI